MAKNQNFSKRKGEYMIIVELIGGLGNQLFEYAYARKISHIKKVPLKFDMSFFDNWPEDVYRLRYFNIKENFATTDETQLLKGRPKTSFTAKVYKKISGKTLYDKKSHIKEPPFTCNDNISKMSDDVYLEGWWGNERYFKDIESIIRREFTLRKELDNDNEELLEKIILNNSVSVHIRRGDYLFNPYFADLTLDYYFKAINFMSSKVRNPYLFIFSDDVSWAKKNLNKLEMSKIFVDINGNKTDYKDLVLMSKCKHNIIANSTFSWWGAWLNNNPKKIIIAPSRWFNNIKAQKFYEKGDFVPSSWIKM